MKKEIVKDTLLYSLANFLVRAFGFIRSIIVARFLGPSLYGLWNALSIILEYSRYSHLGVLNAMNREIPLYRGKKDYAKLAQIRNFGFSMASVPSFAIGLLLIIFSIFIGGHARSEWVVALRATAILVFLRQMYDFLVLLFRSDNDFRTLSKMHILFSITDLALITVMVIRFGFYGFLWAMVITHALVLGYIFCRIARKYDFRFYFNKNLFLHLFRIGILITLIAVVVGLRTTIDRLMIIKFLGVTELGYFGISYVLIQFIFLIPSALSQIMYPRLVERYGSSNNDTGSLRNYIEVTTLILAYSMPVLIGVIFLLLPFGIRLLLPQYIPGIVAAQITILGLFFFSTETMAGNFLVTTDRLYAYFAYSVIAIGINFVLDYAFLKAGFGINGVALGGVLVTSFVYTSFVLGSVMFHYLRDWIKTFFYILKVYFPFFYSLGILLILSRSDLHLAGQTVVFCIFCLPLFWKLEKDTKAISFVLGVMRNTSERQ